ncbi:fungal hydrophobin-domain-containing protein [Cladorrhinum samala]|uniref:Fungal hydrophobin-domain-containing protein n=1 Tax=Cladorrhinum samala TaxID=585594 RepID=A0AAV9I1W4_9PEZI|nr:fungal hydrophobin-domain-containing protein [Cladorrhinum samala]
MKGFCLKVKLITTDNPPSTIPTCLIYLPAYLAYLFSTIRASFFTMKLTIFKTIMLAAVIESGLAVADDLCPEGALYTVPQCCRTNMLNAAALGCRNPPSIPEDGTQFKSICAASMRKASCCTVPVDLVKVVRQQLPIYARGVNPPGSLRDRLYIQELLEAGCSTGKPKVILHPNLLFTLYVVCELELEEEESGLEKSPRSCGTTECGKRAPRYLSKEMIRSLQSVSDCSGQINLEDETRT